MDTKTFINFFEKAVKKDLTPNDLLKIHNHSLKTSMQNLMSGKTERNWHESVLNNINNIVS